MTIDSTIGVYSKEMKSFFQIYICTPMFIAILIMVKIGFKQDVNEQKTM